MFLNGGSGKDKLTGGAGADTIYGLGGDDSLSGLAGEDVLTGGAGNDTLSGGADDDYLMGDAGNDRIDGGTGFDWAGYEDATAAVRVDLALTTAQNTLGAGTDTLVSIEYVHGSAYADTLSGTSGFNYIFGGDGNDSLAGRAGDDFLAGGAGDDTVDGGIGIDTVSFDDGVVGGVAVYLLGGVAFGHGDDRLVSIENLYGSAYDDELYGDSSGNYIYGGDGDDKIGADGGGYTGGDAPTPSTGQDVLDGGAGNDLFVPGQSTDVIVAGGDGVDAINYSFGGDGPALRGVKVDLAATGSQAVDAGHSLILSSVEQVYGTEYGDTLSANSSANLLAGFNGTDVYVFRSVGELGNGANADTIWDSMSESDLIDLSAIDADTTLAGDQAFGTFSFVQGGPNAPQAFTGQAGQIIENYDSVKGMYLVQFDTNGDAQADAALWIQGNGVTAANFIL